jgi:hypothetical protein
MLRGLDLEVRDEVGGQIVFSLSQGVWILRLMCCGTELETARVGIHFNLESTCEREREKEERWRGTCLWWRRGRRPLTGGESSPGRQKPMAAAAVASR